MEIKTVALIGIGALGTMYGYHLTKKLDKEHVRFVCDEKRSARYQKEGIYCNDEACDFQYISPEASCKPADLLIFTVKFTALPQAIKDAANQVGKDTIILSFLNGIRSEELIGEAFGQDKMLYCTVQGMDALKTGNRMYYKEIGNIALGEKDNRKSEKLRIVTDFLVKAGLSYVLPENMMAQLWGKLVMNTGVNQACAVFYTPYGGVQKEGKPREYMIGAMKETFAIAQKEGIPLPEKEVERWLDILSKLNPESGPSLYQDIQAKRKTEVDLFGTTISTLGKKHGVPTPYNDYFVTEIRKLEEAF